MVYVAECSGLFLNLYTPTPLAHVYKHLVHGKLVSLQMSAAQAIGDMDSEAEGAGAGGPAPSLHDHLFVTRGADAATWHLWNTSGSALSLSKDEVARGHLVRADMEQTDFCYVRIVRDIVVPGLKDRLCAVGSDIQHCEPFDTSSAAADIDLVQMCISKGIKCTTFLENYVKSKSDEELDLGERMHALCVSLIQEMMDREYDIMHHYPLFNRMIGMYYSENDRTAPPSLQDAIRPGGLLDKSVREHESLHGLSVAGSDRLTFTRWNYPYVKPDEVVCKETDYTPVSESRRDSLTSSPCVVGAEDELARRGKLYPIAGCKEQQRDQEPASTVRGLPCATVATHASRDLEPIENIYWFNNHPGVLTDRPAAFPYTFPVHVGQGVTFDNLITYCATREPDAQIGTLPFRREWGSVNPVLLMADNIDPHTGKIAYSYVVTSRGHLSELKARPCYNEVFLPNRPVTRLNLDVDMKCCVLCRNRYTVNANDETKRKLGSAMASSMLLMIAETLLSMAKLSVSKNQSDGPDTVNLKELIRNIGKLSVYIRPSPTKNKLSLRMLWYLPMELCSIRGIEAYRSLLQEMEKMSLRYVLLSYPEDLRSCGLCELSKAITQCAVANNARCLRVTGNTRPKRLSAVDKAPYALRKSVRLPNCCKENIRFEYVETFNDQVKLPGSGFDDHLSLSVGLSSNPVSQDVTFLGDLFNNTLQERKLSFTIACEADDTPDLKQVNSEAARLIALWGVPVTVKKTGTGLFCVQATEKSTAYPCPKHNRVHSNCKLSALVFATQTVYKCFVP